MPLPNRSPNEATSPVSSFGLCDHIKNMVPVGVSALATLVGGSGSTPFSTTASLVSLLASGSSSVLYFIESHLRSVDGQIGDGHSEREERFHPVCCGVKGSEDLPVVADRLSRVRMGSALVGLVLMTANAAIELSEENFTTGIPYALAAVGHFASLGFQICFEKNSSETVQPEESLPLNQRSLA